ncbi:tetratricopeptide repeat protein [Paraburkholderia acidisoli]|uniref:tetratricopeptide repeat protein n=1 Tax=Paraburkholderia acidisoli TaxID=2571748 RepID=UPI0018EEECFA|nr:hypothetical protein [Paraburkholderia acidisoli]
MLTESIGLQPPRNPQAFEDFCHIVYMKVLDDPTATKYGRSGQKQDGVDVFVTRKAERYGVQCKQKTFGKLTKGIIDDEVKSADAGDVRIDRLIVATTVANDVKLVAYATKLTDKRRAEGKFEVHLAFWDTLETLVRSHPELQYLYSPQMSGGAFWEQNRRLDQHSAQIMQRLDEQAARLQGLADQSAPYAGASASRSIPDARANSLNKLVDTQLDAVKQLLVTGKFEDALKSLTALGSNLDAFDEHQKARWYSQRAHCYWHQTELNLAAADFEAAWKLTPHDDKAISNHATGRLLVGNIDDAARIINEAREKFPASTTVYSVWIQVVDQQGRRVHHPRDVPPEMRKNGDVLTVLGWLAAHHGLHREAARLAKLAIEAGSVGHQQTSLRLLALVNQAAENGVLASLSLLPNDLKIQLKGAISYFLPFDETIWQRQDQATTAQTVACLGYALLMTGRASEAPELLREGVKRYPEDGQIARVYLETLRKTNTSVDRALEFGRTCIDIIDEEARMMVAEMAAMRADFDTLARIQKSFREEDDEGLRNELQAFAWMATANSGKGSELASAMTLQSVTSMKSVAAKVVALNVAFALGVPWAKQAVEEMAASIDADSSMGEALMVAQACLAVEMYDQTIALLKERLPTKGVSDPHKILLEALIRSGARKKAHQMLEAFPASAMDDPEIRALAVDLANAANDWKQLLKLSDLQLRAHPNRAEAWTYRAAVLFRQKKTSDLRALLKRDIPLNLEGSIPAQAQLARFEIELGNRARGFRRLYRMFRSALGDVKAAVAYFSNILLLNNPDVTPAKATSVSEGTAITIVSDKGEIRRVVIDPDDLGQMPPAPEFINTASDLYGRFVGKQLDDIVLLPSGLGGDEKYRIADIDSAYRHLTRLADEVNRRAVAQNGSMFSIHMSVKEDGDMDFTEVLKLLTARSSQVNEAFELYSSGPATLGILGKFLGVGAMVVAADWPDGSKPKLYVCQGTAAERSAAEALLASRPKSVVLDLTALNELVANDLESALRLAEKVYVSTSAVEALDELILSAKTDRARGHMREEGGRISVIEYGANYHQQRYDYLRKLRRCVDDYCEVAPAWGNEELPENLSELSPHLGDDSYDALLLCLEHEAILLTLDGRLREIAKALGKIDGVWPQVFCNVALAHGFCSEEAYRAFVVWSIKHRRTHVALSAHEFLWLFKSPASTRQSATSAIVGYVAEPTLEVGSIASVILEVAQRMLVSGTTTLALCQYLYRATAPLFARPQLKVDALEKWFVGKLDQFLLRNFTKRTGRHVERDISLAKVNMWSREIAGAMSAAKAAGLSTSVEELGATSIGVVALYGATTPLFIAYPPPDMRTADEQEDIQVQVV